MSEEKKVLEPTGDARLEKQPAESKKDGFELNPKYSSVQEQAKAYGEAQKAITQKSQEVAELKKQLEEAKMLYQNLTGKSQNLHSDNQAKEAFEGVSDSQGQNPDKMQDVNKMPSGISQEQVGTQLRALKENHKKELSNIISMYQAGKISMAQAIKLKEVLDAKMNGSTQNVLKFANSLQNEISELRKNKIIDGFKQTKPDFFSTNERLEVIDYLKSVSDDLSPDELENVSKLVEKVENGAIERFKANQAQEELINKMNEQAKVRLNSSVEGTGQIAFGQRVFSKDEIQKMSNSEFRKHEKQIMDQMKKGMIKG